MGWSKVKSNKSKFIKPDDLKDARKYDAVQTAGQSVADGIAEPYPAIKRRNLRKVDLLDNESDADRMQRHKQNWDAQSEAMYGKDAGKWFDDSQPPPLPEEVNLDNMIADVKRRIGDAGSSSPDGTDIDSGYLDNLIQDVNNKLPADRTKVMRPKQTDNVRKTG